MQFARASLLFAKIIIMDSSNKDRVLKSFDVYQDTAKQMITLATLIIGLTITYFKDLIVDTGGEKKILLIPFSIFFISIVCGVITLLNLAGTLGSPEIPDKDVSIYRRQIGMWMKGQVLTFLAAILIDALFILFIPN